LKRLLCILNILLLLLLCGCAAQPQARIAATTLPVYEFTARLCEGTGITVTRLVTESVSCLHDYSLSVRQVRAVESADTVVVSGAGLEEFMHDLLSGRNVIDASTGIPLLGCEHDHEDDHHHHEADSHIWLSPENAKIMCANICAGLEEKYPQYASVFRTNLAKLTADIQILEDYGKQQLSSLSCRELITFHDGFAYFAQSFDLHILAAVEEESGSEASARELKELIGLIESYQIPAIFTEKSGSVSAASIIARETGCETYALDMAMAGDSWFDAMYHNINTMKEALQ
jgi:ABC-type Zn uptake system ZnuABC Zn-binding protein ZnuA